MSQISVEMQNSLRGQGFLILKDGESFAVRIVIPAGQMTKEFSDKISEVAVKYGKGHYTLTQRLDVEIPFIKFDDIEGVRKELTDAGLIVGGTGRRVRSIHTCKGSVCRFGLYDTEAVTKRFTEKFYKGYYAVGLPNKFRIVVSGCRNSCAKPQMSDIGISGRKLDAVAVFLGGMNGATQMMGTEIEGIYTLDQAEKIIENAIEFYKNNGEPGERFPKMVQRIGFETVVKAVTKGI